MVPDLSGIFDALFTKQSAGNHIKTGLGLNATTMLRKSDFVVFW